jgi:hypothetical protein
VPFGDSHVVDHRRHKSLLFKPVRADSLVNPPLLASKPLYSGADVDFQDLV